MKLIVGLGNPGPRYAATRHNVGFAVLDRWASRLGVGFSTEKFHAWFASAEYRGEKVALLKPTTFMNRSGQAVAAAGRFYKLELADLLVIADDLALPVGKLRLRRQGSAGGQKGLQDIVDRVGSDEWCRLRIGIGAAVGDASSYVLSRFTADEEPLMVAAFDRAVEAVECWLADGPEQAMNRFNVSGPE